MEQKQQSEMSSVRNFYKGRCILVTGGAGFMGKVLIEKLLYSVPDIGEIYILMRPKRGKSVSERIGDMKLLPLFDRLRSERPTALQKLRALDGDISLPNFGLIGPDMVYLTKKVSVVFHFAATLRLEAPLRASVKTNTLGTFQALDVARKLHKLAIFVHLSTAFCYPDYSVLEETVHQGNPISPWNVIDLLEILNDEQLELVTPSLLGPHPNSYTYSKRLAELLVEETCHSLRVVIARPSIVCPTYQEPMTGWVDNLNGPVGVMLGAGKGVIRTMMVDGSLIAQVIPVDIAINAIIAIGMIEGTKEKRSDTVPVYNVNIGHQKPTTWGHVLEVAKEYARKFPLAWPLWYPNGDITTNRILHEYRRICFHLVPAYIIDFLLMIMGQRRFMVRIQDRISQGLKLLQYFTTRPWSFPCPNYDSIQGKLNDEEKVIFNTDITNADRDLYVKQCIEGGRVYCFKEDPAKIHINRIYHNFLYVLDWGFKIMFWLLLFLFIISWFEPAKAIISIYGGPLGGLPFLR